MTPHSPIASRAYAEQVGVNRQEGDDFIGDRYRLYSFIGSDTIRLGRRNNHFAAAFMRPISFSLRFHGDHIRVSQAVKQVTFNVLHLQDRT